MGGNGHGQLYSTRIDIPADTRAEVITILNQTLASTLDLKTQVKQAHWNVKGMNFYSLHTLFDDMASELEEYVDMVAERVTALGGLALGTARVVAHQSDLPEYPFDILDGSAHVTALAERYAAYGHSTRNNIDITDDLGDADTADLYTEISRAIDKRLWFLEAHLQAAVEPVTVDDAKDDANGSVQKTATAAKATKTVATSKTDLSKAKKTKNK